jgi:hypothetical protein
MFFEIFKTGGGLSSRAPFGNWRPRSRLSLSGTVLSGATLVHRLVSDFVPMETEKFASIPIDLFIKDGEYFLTSDLFFDFTMRIFKEFGGTIHFKRYFSGESQFINDITFVATKKSFSYVYNSYDYGSDYHASIGLGGHVSYRVNIFRDSLDNLNVYLYDFHNAYWINSVDVALDFDAPYLFTGLHTQQTINTIGDGRQAAINLADSTAMSVISCLPALFHTQSKATTEMLGNVSRNFESFMESSGFMPTVISIAVDTPSALWKSVSQKLPILERIRLIAKGLCSGYLAYAFALQPSLESLEDVISTFLTENEEVTSEALMKFEGDSDSFDDLPSGLKDQLLVLAGPSVVRYNCSFRTQIIMDLTSPQTAEIVSQLAVQGTRFGISPEPVYAWAAIPFTFVFDACVIPMSSLLRDLQSRVAALDLKGTTIGHSISIEVSSSSGKRVHIYIRSTPTGLYIDPPRDSWLQSRGLNLPVAVSLALLQIL